MLETAIAPVGEATETDGGVWIEALPARIYTTPQYGEVPVPVDKLQRMITNFKTNIRGQEVATDFEHGLDSTKGLQASGWYRDFDLRPSSDDPNQTSLWAKVEFTEDAKKDIHDKKYKYFSLEWDDEYETDTGHVVADVVIGGGLTNRPVAKRTMPINFSEELWNELDEDTRKQFAVWTTKYVNSLPDSAFLYKDSNGRHLPYKDASGKIDLPHLRNAIARANQIKGISQSTADSIIARARAILKKAGGGSNTNSEFGFADAYPSDMTGNGGDPDEPSIQKAIDALRQAIAKADDPEDIAALKKVLALIQEGEAAENTGIRAAMSEAVARAVLSMSEAAAWEHSDPGIAVPLYASADGQPDPGVGLFVPRVSDSVANTDPAVAGGWRREPLPVLNPSQTQPQDIQESRNTPKHMSEGGRAKLSVQLSEEQLVQLAGMVETDETDPDKFMEAATKQFAELKTFKENVGQSQQERQFSEQFPDVWREHQALLENNRTTAARSFSESVSRISKVKSTADDGTITYEPTRNGFSGLALETIAEAHKKFAEGTGTLADFEGTVKAIANGGVVEFGEVGSSQEPEVHEIDSTTATGIAAARRLFAEKVAEVQAETKDGKQQFSEYGDAIAEASKRYPDLAEAYRATAA